MKTKILAVLLSISALTVYAKTIVVDIPAGTDTVTLRLNQSKPPTPVPPTPVPDPCTRTGNTVIVNTGLPNTPYTTKSFNPAPRTILAFKFRTPAGTALQSGFAKATVMTAAGNGKTVRVTKCPSDTEPVSRYCSDSASEVASVRYFINYDDRRSCVLKTNTTYYMQVINKYSTNGGYTCGGDVSCGFYFRAQ